MHLTPSLHHLGQNSPGQLIQLSPGTNSRFEDCPQNSDPDDAAMVLNASWKRTTAYLC